MYIGSDLRLVFQTEEKGLELFEGRSRAPFIHFFYDLGYFTATNLREMKRGSHQDTCNCVPWMTLSEI
jgi:hypothetical protein